LVGGFQDNVRGSVISFQLNGPAVRIDFFKIQYVADVRSSPTVNGLVVVAYDAQISMVLGKKADQYELSPVGILVLVHHDVFKLTGIEFQYVFVFTENPDGIHDDIVKIQRIVVLQRFLIPAVHFSDFTHTIIRFVNGFEFVGIHQIVLSPSDGVYHHFRRENLGVHIQSLQAIFDQRKLVIGIKN
jgi:hypothetical protein